MKKSIVIIGKGPSIKRCDKEYINSFDDVAICGRPIFLGYEHLIGNRADYDFLNCGDPRIYNRKLVKKLGIKEIFNIGAKKIERKREIVPFGYIKYEPDLRKKYISFFKDNYDLDPSCGLFALKYIIDTNKYDKISLVGFDMLKIEEEVYYFKKNEIQETLRHYYYDKKKDDKWIYDTNGIRKKKSGHDTEKSIIFLEDIFEKNKDIQFEILSNRNFKKLDNLKEVYKNDNNQVSSS